MRFDFDLSRTGPARPDVYAVTGKRVGAVLDTRLAAGLHRADWSARGSGRLVGHGVYFSRR